MVTNAPGTRPLGTPGDQPTTATTPGTPGVTSTGTGSVNVYDQDDAVNTTNTTTTRDLSTPVETRSGGMNWTWIISVIVLIALVYFLFQWIF